MIEINEELRIDLGLRSKKMEEMSINSKRIKSGSCYLVDSNVNKLADMFKKNDQNVNELLEQYSKKQKQLKLSIQNFENKYKYYKKRSLSLEAINSELKAKTFLDKRIFNREFRHSLHKEIFAKIDNLIHETDLKKQVREVKKYLKVREEKIYSLEKQIKSLKRELEKSQNESKEYEEEILKVWKDIEDLTRNNKGLEEEIKLTLDYNEKQKKNLAKIQFEANENVKFLENEVNTVKNLIARKENTIILQEKHLNQSQMKLRVTEEESTNIKNLLEKNLNDFKEFYGKYDCILEELKIKAKEFIEMKKSNELLCKELSLKIEMINKNEILVNQLIKRKNYQQNKNPSDEIEFDREDYLVAKHEAERLSVIII